MHLRNLKTNKQNPKVSRKKEIVQIKAEINEIKNRQMRKKLIKPQARSLKRSVRLLVELIRRKRENTQITNICNERRVITKDPRDRNRIVRGYP